MDVPDVNDDGFSEFTVADGGADAVFVRVFAVRSAATAPQLVPFTVAAPGDRLVTPGPLEFAMSGSAGASASASCGSFSNGDPSLIVSGMVGSDRMHTAVLSIDATRATVVSSRTVQVGPRRHPVVDGPWCDRASTTSQPQPPMCHSSSMEGDVDGDGLSDVVAIGSSIKPGGTCASNARRQVMIDLASNGSWDVRQQPLGCGTWCTPFVVTDLNADAKGEIFINEGHLAAPVSALIAVYELEQGRLEPVPFPSGSNRFPLQESWQGYLGAFCPDPWSFWTWSLGTDEGGGLTHRITYRPYLLETSPLRFELAESPFTAEQGMPKIALRGWDGEFCGKEAGPFG
jgi:hypothetical protein